MPKLLARVAFVVLAGVGIGSTGVTGQTMKPKYDQKCLDDAGRSYISCMANARTETAKDQCSRAKVEAEKGCKR